MPAAAAPDQRQDHDASSSAVTSTTRVAVVTGGSRGIGAAIAKKLADKDTVVVVNYNQSKDAAAQLVADIEARGYRAEAIQANVSTPEGASDLISTTVKKYGKISVLVNNAGVFEGGPIEDTTAKLVDGVFDVNVKAVVLTTAAAASHLSEDGASIINISSIVTKTPFANISVYAASKGAVEAFSRALAVELGPKNVRVNSVSPGYTKTDMLPEALHEVGANSSLLKRLGESEDIADVVQFLADRRSRWLTGQNIVASGGIGFAL